MTVLGGLQRAAQRVRCCRICVSIPMTVLGGLQRINRRREAARRQRFNTDDGIRRATTPQGVEGRLRRADRFNTDDGIRRATTASTLSGRTPTTSVSIPMTVLGGLQRSKRSSTVVARPSCFNTDDGIRRATTKSECRFLRGSFRSFNTDDGIRRATTLCP